MADAQAFIQRMAIAAPSLQQWAASYIALGYVDDFWVQFAHELTRHAANGTIPELRAIAPLLEEALAQETRDEVSLSFIDSLIALAEERQFDMDGIRAALGPLGQQTWDSLQAGLCAIRFDPSHIRDFCGTPAHLHRCVPSPGSRLQAGALLARIRHSTRHYELRVQFPCLMDRYVKSEGSDLNEGDLVLYVNTSAGSTDHRPSLPYAQLVEITPVAAA